MSDVGDGCGGDLSQVATLTDAAALLREVVARPGYAIPDGEVLSGLRAAQELVAVAEATYLKYVQELQARPGIIRGIPAGKAVRTFLTEVLHRSDAQVSRDLKAASATMSPAPDLPAMATALLEGAVTREHVDVAAGALSKIPRQYRRKILINEDGSTRTGLAFIDAIVTEEAKAWAPGQIQNLASQLIQRLDPDRSMRFDPDAWQRRSATIVTEHSTGMGIYKIVLDPVTHLQVNAAVVETADHLPTDTVTSVGEDGTTVTRPGKPERSHRLADAVAHLLLAGATHLGLTIKPTPTPSTSTEPTPSTTTDPVTEPVTDEAAEDGDLPAEPEAPVVPPGVLAEPCGVTTEICVITTLDQLVASATPHDPQAQATAGLARVSLAGKVGTFPGSVLQPWVLARLACDSPIRRILLDPNGAVLHYGQTHRLATTHQKRALTARDTGCVIPGCSIPAEWCDAHHVIAWQQGGATNIDNLTLLCRRHHTAHHAGVYSIEMRDGVPWVQLPAWHDPARPWVRNTTHLQHQTADRIARRLCRQPELPFGRPTYPPPPKGQWPCV